MPFLYDKAKLEQLEKELEKKISSYIDAKYPSGRRDPNEICTDQEFLDWCKKNGFRAYSAYSGTIDICGISLLVRNERTIFECEDIEFVLDRTDGFYPKKTNSKYFKSFEKLEQHLNEIKLFAKRVEEMKNLYKAQEDFV